MDSIDSITIREAANEVFIVQQMTPTLTIHTVTVTLNGAHGGADVTIQGEVPDDRGGPWRDVEYVREVH